MPGDEGGKAACLSRGSMARRILNILSVEITPGRPSSIRVGPESVPQDGPLGRSNMKYAMLVHETAANLEARKHATDEPYVAAWRAYHKALTQAGVYAGGAPLREAGTATTVRLRNGNRQVQDGPIAETKEQLGGFFILELPSLDAALDWAARCPAAATGALEVRPIDADFLDYVVKP